MHFMFKVLYKNLTMFKLILNIHYCLFVIYRLFYLFYDVYITMLIKYANTFHLFHYVCAYQVYIYIYSERKLQLLNLDCLSASGDLQEEFEETKGVIRIHISKKKRQHNGQKKKYKSTNNDLQNIHSVRNIHRIKQYFYYKKSLKIPKV